MAEDSKELVPDNQISIDTVDFHQMLKKLEKKMVVNAEKVFDKVVKMALEGDRFAMKLFLDKCFPNASARILKVPIKQLETLEDIKIAERTILEQVYNGEFSWEEGKGLLSLLTNYKDTVFTLKYAHKSDVIEHKQLDYANRNTQN